jgi:serine/threonine protein phosphatase PrpC
MDSNNEPQAFYWVGNHQPHLDQPDVTICGNVLIGRYGGSSAGGATKNEDGALVWSAADGAWEFAMLLDAHNSAQSAELLLRAINYERDAIQQLLNLPLQESFYKLQNHLVSRFLSPALRTRCSYIQGETACLIAVRRGRFLWWLSIGDCSLYLLHPEYARHGQFALNQRIYFEWIGKANTFDLPVPCYSSGVRELRRGPNHLVMATDGLLDGADDLYTDPRLLYQDLTPWDDNLGKNIQLALNRIHEAKGADSATVIAWRVVSHHDALSAS